MLYLFPWQFRSNHRAIGNVCFQPQTFLQKVNNLKKHQLLKHSQCHVAAIAHSEDPNEVKHSVNG